MKHAVVHHHHGFSSYIMDKGYKVTDEKMARCEFDVAVEKNVHIKRQ